MISTNLSHLMSKWKKPLLDLMFCISFIREMLFLSGKSEGIFKRDICGNPVHVFLCTNEMIIFSQIFHSMSSMGLFYGQNIECRYINVLLN